MDKKLYDTYYDPSKGFSSIKSLLSHVKDAKITTKYAKEWLEKQPTYSMHKQARKKYVRNKVIVSTIDQQWQADLVDLQSLQKYNEGYKYLLTCIDIFSKYAWAVPLKSKTSSSIIDAFKIIFKSRRLPYKLQTDAGTEFVNKDVQKFLKSLDIDFFTTNSEMKASVVERFNRTLKERMWKIFTKFNSYTYFNFLPQLLNNYNNSLHRTIGMKPSQVNETNASKIRQKAFKNDATIPPVFNFSIGDKVRISKMKRHFEKGYTPNWTEEYFIVTQRIARTPVVYKLKDQKDEIISGIFYEPELQKIESDESDLHVIEKVLKTRKHNNKTEHFVKWRGYPEKFNSWVSDIVRL